MLASSKIILFLKAGNSPAESFSYRPISLLNTIEDMMERIMCNRLLPIVEALGGLSDQQFVFRMVQSAIDAIKLVPDVAQNIMHGKGIAGKYCRMVTLDVENAFKSTSADLIRRSFRAIFIPNCLTVCR